MKLFLCENVLFDEKGLSFTAQAQDFESAHTGTWQENDKYKNALSRWKCLVRWKMPFFPSTGMCSYMILNQHIQVLGKKLTSEMKLSFWVKMSCSMKKTFLSQHRHVLICDFESAHTGSRQESAKWNETLFLCENVLLDEKGLSFPAQACANMWFCISTHWYYVRKWQVYWNSCVGEDVFFDDKCPSFPAQACATMWFWVSTHRY